MCLLPVIVVIRAVQDETELGTMGLLRRLGQEQALQDVALVSVLSQQESRNKIRGRFKL